MVPMLCVPLWVDEPEILNRYQLAVQSGATLIELRADRGTADQLCTVMAQLRAAPATPLPHLLVTVRSRAEGGHFAGDTAALTDLLSAAVTGGAEYLDVEWAVYQREPGLRQQVQAWTARGVKMVLSYHDFKARPADLHERITQMEQTGLDIVKIAWQAESLEDGLLALELSAQRPGRRVLIAMDAAGQISRLLAARAGMPFTFAALPTGGTAPGQPTVSELDQMYRYNQQRPDWPVYGVIGWPVGHSRSPAIHNAGLRELALPGVYVPLPIAPDYIEFDALVRRLRTVVGIRGLSVTIPHKENALLFARRSGAEIAPLARQIGAVNTLWWDAAERLHADNTDLDGALDALTAGMGQTRADLAGQRVALLGAGGAARALVAGLVAAGATVVIYNRTLERAATLAQAFSAGPGKAVAAPWENLCKSCCEIVINCTPIGMYPKCDASPIDDFTDWSPQTVVMDTVYNPVQTLLLQRAAAANLRTITGVDMFVRQAARQFTHFTGHPAPVAVFARILTLD